MCFWLRDETGRWLSLERWTSGREVCRDHAATPSHASSRALLSIAPNSSTSRTVATHHHGFWGAYALASRWHAPTSVSIVRVRYSRLQSSTEAGISLASGELVSSITSLWHKTRPVHTFKARLPLQLAVKGTGIRGYGWFELPMWHREAVCSRTSVF